MTLSSIFYRFKLRISLTLTLVFAEAGLWLFFPLFIGKAIDGLLNGDNTSLIYLGILGFSQLIISALRRFYDTRVYAGIYEKISVESINKNPDTKTTTLSARVSMIRELVEFFENSFPGLVMSIISLVGTLFILIPLNINIFYGCLLLLFLIGVVFGLSSKRTVSYNHHYNNALEEQVDIIERRKPTEVKSFMKSLMRWNIKLSDLETVNFSLVWFGGIALIIFSVVDSTSNGNIEQGVILSIIMYIFQFIEEIFVIPMHYQQWLRLREISERMGKEY